MVVLHPSRSKCMNTQSAETFWDERIAGFLPGEKPPKMQFWRLMLFLWYFLIYFKEVSLSNRQHKLRCIIFTKSKQGKYCTTLQVCPKLHLRALTLHRMSSILFFQKKLHFSLGHWRNPTGNYSQQVY